MIQHFGIHIYFTPYPCCTQVLSRPGIASMLPVSASSNALASLVVADASAAVPKSPLLSHAPAPAAVTASATSAASSSSTFVLAAAAAAHAAEDAEDAQLKTDETQNDY